MVAQMRLFDDPPKSPATAKASQGAVQLRDYQEEALAAIEKCREQGQNRLLLHLATGLGKTVCFNEYARRRNTPAIIMAHREELVQQARAKLLTIWPEIEGHVGIVKGDYNETGRHITIASVQTLSRENRFARAFPGASKDRVGLVITDEVHHGAAETYRWVYDQFGLLVPGGKVTHLGVTATPKRSDGAGLDDIFDAVAYSMGIREGILGGHLSDISGYTLVFKNEDMADVKLKNGDYDLTALEKAVKKVARCEAIVECWLEQAKLPDGTYRPTVAFCTSVAHSEMLAEAFTKYGIKTATVDGTMEEKTRRKNLADFSAGRVQVMCNCLDEQTEILTQRGWVNIDTIQDDDITATFNLQTENLEWQPISRIVRRDRAENERMVQVKNQSIDIRVTEGHRMVIKAKGAKSWKVVEAKELPTIRGPYQLPTAVNCEDTRALPLSLDECKFIGLWIADGHLDKNGSRGVEIGQSTAYPEANEEIQRILTSCGFDWKMSQSHAAGSTSIQNRYRIPRGSIGGQLARRGFDWLSKYLDKDFCSALFSLDKNQAQALFEGVWLGDGLKYKTRRTFADPRRANWLIVNTNYTLLQNLQQLAILRGFGATLTINKLQNGTKGTKPLYQLNIRKARTIATNNSHVPTSGGNPARFETEFKQERVWCVTNANGTIVTRRNGRVMIMGQCMVLTEGWDEPKASCIIMARPTRSQSLYIQCAGRGTRLYPGKPNCLILDVADVSSRNTLIAPVTLEGAFGLKKSKDDKTSKQIDSVARQLRMATMSVGLAQGAEEAEVQGGKTFDPFADPFAGDERVAFRWTMGQSGLTLSLPSDKYGREKERRFLVVVQRKDLLWDVVEFARWQCGVNGAGYAQYTSEEKFINRHGLPDETWAIGEAERYARRVSQGIDRLAGKDASWRSSGRLASDAQLGVVRRMYKEVPKGSGPGGALTLAEASALIDKGIAQKIKVKLTRKAGELEYA